ncbi:hypothetical protein KJS94_11185 [Flavihumibacter rivuli]|uniref:hypothetical protein n=1 Tax=Flavihumibacter rivuli TaxID=2838156 RepID=UPI001BDE3184|nr:hypothetical protein [Flavihumibacter rivuli]ULQ55205.1 hypothetical protein KJS94_11185 [Flavihumibacter rivuli]
MNVVDKATSAGNKLFLYFRDVRIEYLVSNGNKHYPSITNTAEIFIFEDFILVIRKQNLLMVTYLKPVVISGKNWIHKLGSAVESLTPVKFIYWDQRRKEVQIQLIGLQYNHITSTLTLKQLTDEQINEIKAFEKRIELSKFS